MPRSPLRRLVLDLRFSGRHRQSGDGNGSTLTLTLIPGASGAATTTPNLPGNLRRLCSKFLLFCHQGLTGGASAMVGWRSNGCVLWLFFGCVIFFFGWCVATCVVVCAGMTNAPVTSCVCSLYQMRASETCKFLHPSCMKTCNAFALLVFMQLGCTQYEIHEFLREHVQRKSVARKRATLLRCTCTNLHGTCTELARSLHANLKSSVPIYIHCFFWHIS
jgi:hypothetical protein